MAWGNITPNKGGPGGQNGMWTPGGIQYPQIQPIGTNTTMSTTIPGNPLAQAGQYYTNTAYGLANGLNTQLDSMLSGGMSGMERKVFNQSVNTGKNKLAGQYEGMPGHSSFDQQFGGVVGEAMNNTLQSRYSMIPQYAQSLLTAAGTPYQTGMNAYGQGSNISNAMMGTVTGASSGMPYIAPSSGGGGGKK